MDKQAGKQNGVDTDKAAELGKQEANGTMDVDVNMIEDGGVGEVAPITANEAGPDTTAASTTGPRAQEAAE